MYPFQIGLSGQALEFFIQLSKEAPSPYESPPPQVIDPQGQYVATIRTTQGDIVVELYSDQAPTNVNQFVFLAQEGWYDNNAFLRVITDTAVIAGDPTNTGLLGDPGYRCAMEVAPDLKFDSEGIVGLISTTRNSTGSQFFITLSPQPDLDGRFTIIGKVVEGLDVLHALTAPGPSSPPTATGDQIETIVIEKQ
ncbi:MAG TPA: peptidylprolyl isomerase [Chloroflexi bacterium]|nr:peptidylprolyl isomerase [Chloroflexota bacterium]